MSCNGSPNYGACKLKAAHISKKVASICQWFKISHLPVINMELMTIQNLCKPLFLFVFLNDYFINESDFVPYHLKPIVLQILHYTRNVYIPLNKGTIIYLYCSKSLPGFLKKFFVGHDNHACNKRVFQKLLFNF